MDNDKQINEVNNKIRKVFLECLPRRASGKTISWKNSIGYIIPFIYDGIEGNIKIIEYIKDTHDKLKIIYNNKEHIIEIRELINCYLARILNIRTLEFKVKIGQIFKDKQRDIIITNREIRIDYKGRKYKYYNYYCNACGFNDGWIRETALLTSNSCPKCGDGFSIPNKIGLNVLEQLNIIFKTEYSPEWIGLRRYDFYFKLNNKKYILEMDGGFHNKDNLMNGQTAEESKSIDNYKDRLANEHDIEVIRIDCDYTSVKTRFDFIKQNMLDNVKLNELFDLDAIDWLNVCEFTLTSRVKEACDYWNSGIESTKEIGIIMKLHSITIENYLKQGNEFNWCKYNTTKTSKPKTSKPRTGKPVEIFKDEISLGVFESCLELERRSEVLFGVKLYQSHTSLVCRGKRKSYKGYTFTYI